MTAILTAVYERHDDWFIGYIEELSGVKSPGKFFTAPAPSYVAALA
jgi:hypothetical protein